MKQTNLPVLTTDALDRPYEALGLVSASAGAMRMSLTFDGQRSKQTAEVERKLSDQARKLGAMQ